MVRHKDALSIGIAALALAVLLRGISPASLAAMENPDLLSFLVYLQTGRVVRYPTSPAPEKEPLPTVPEETAPPVTEPLPNYLRLTAGDADAVTLYDLVDYEPDVEQLLLSPLDWNLKGTAPKVLIVHTHSTESYTRQPGEDYEEESAYRTLNGAYNMLSIGQELARVLEAGGVSVLHDRTLHDHPSYDGSYDHARQTISGYLAAYPSICMVIDLHRDALDFNQDPQLTTLANINGQKSAQLMLVAGTDNNVSFPNWEQNLATGLKLMAVLEKMYPGITRPALLRPQRYNLDLSPGSLLIEVGANGNTHSEAILAAQALGQAIIAMAQGVNLQNTPPL